MSTVATPAAAAPTATARRWQVATLLGVGLTMGLEFAHLLELEPKLTYPPEVYLHVNQSLYRWFGGPVGGGIYVGSIAATGVLAFLVRWRAARVRAGCALAAQATAFVTFLALIEPVNVRFRALRLGEVPSDFTALRNQWELTHAAGFGLFAVAFLLLVTLPTVGTRWADPPEEFGTRPEGRLRARLFRGGSTRPPRKDDGA